MFEADFQKSVPDNILVEREKDSASFQMTSKNPYDYRLYLKPNIFFMELKSTGAASISLQENVVRPHQIEQLQQRKSYDGAYAGFLFEFRERNLKTKTREHMVYYLDIDKFNKRDKNIKSLTPEYVENLGGIKVEATKKITRYTFNVEKLIQDIKRDVA